jgi:hypothetical protein
MLKNHQNYGLVLFVLCLVGYAGAATVTVTSSSAYVGASANYTLSVTNQTTVSRVDFSFSNWTSTSTDPFSTSTMLSFASLSVSPIFIPLMLVCNLGTTITMSTFQFTLTNMRNPSSTKPYPIGITIYNGSGSVTYNGSLTLSSIANTSFPMVGYSSLLGASNSNVELYLTPSIALQMSSTFVEITY